VASKFVRLALSVGGQFGTATTTVKKGDCFMFSKLLIPLARFLQLFCAELTALDGQQGNP
jgi:hypothetical protein